MITLNAVLIWLLSILAVGSALCVILQKNPIVSALFLVASFFGLGGLYLSLQAPFISAIQILVYAGAITVLFIFVIMLLNLQHDPERFTKARIFKIPRFIILFSLLWIIFSFIHLTAFPIAVPDSKDTFGLEQMAEMLFSKYVFPFELASFLLLIAMVGSVVLAKKPQDEKKKMEILP